MYGVSFSDKENNKFTIYPDNQLLPILNTITLNNNKKILKETSENIYLKYSDVISSLSDKARDIITNNLKDLDIPFKKP